MQNTQRKSLEVNPHLGGAVPVQFFQVPELEENLTVDQLRLKTAPESIIDGHFVHSVDVFPEADDRQEQNFSTVTARSDTEVYLHLMEQDDKRHLEERRKEAINGSPAVWVEDQGAMKFIGLERRAKADPYFIAFNDDRRYRPFECRAQQVNKESVHAVQAFEKRFGNIQDVITTAPRAHTKEILKRKRLPRVLQANRLRGWHCFHLSEANQVEEFILRPAYRHRKIAALKSAKVTEKRSRRMHRIEKEMHEDGSTQAWFSTQRPFAVALERELYFQEKKKVSVRQQKIAQLESQKYTADQYIGNPMFASDNYFE